MSWIRPMLSTNLPASSRHRGKMRKGKRVSHVDFVEKKKKKEQRRRRKKKREGRKKK